MRRQSVYGVNHLFPNTTYDSILYTRNHFLIYLSLSTTTHQNFSRLALFAGKNNTPSTTADAYNSTHRVKLSSYTNYMTTKMTGPGCHLSCCNFSEMFRDSSLFLLHYSLLFQLILLANLLVNARSSEAIQERLANSRSWVRFALSHPLR